MAIVGGLGAAIAFATSVLVSARASRLVGAGPTLAGAMAVGLVVALPIALVAAPRPELDTDTLGWAALAGLGNVVGLLLIYRAYRLGAVGVVATIASTEGAVAAVIAVLLGESLVPGAGPVLAVVALGVALAASSGGEREEGVAIPRERSLRAAALALAAAVAFAFGLYGAGRLAETLPVAWAILPARVVGVLLVTLPLVALGRLRIGREAWPFVAATGIAEIVGFASFVVGARAGIAVTAVLASMFAPLATLAAYVLFRERLGPRQIAGIALIVGGVAALGVLQS